MKVQTKSLRASQISRAAWGPLDPWLCCWGVKLHAPQAHPQHLCLGPAPLAALCGQGVQEKAWCLAPGISPGTVRRSRVRGSWWLRTQGAPPGLTVATLLTGSVCATPALV